MVFNYHLKFSKQLQLRLADKLLQQNLTFSKLVADESVANGQP